VILPHNPKLVVNGHVCLQHQECGCKLKKKKKKKWRENTGDVWYIMVGIFVSEPNVFEALRRVDADDGKGD
jgi:hypothetical protein